MSEQEHAKQQQRMLTILQDIQPELRICFGLLAERIATWNTFQGFWPMPDDPRLQDPTWNLGRIMLMVTELAEAAEGVRKPKPDEHCPNFSSEVIELADAVIRILDYAGKKKLPLAEALTAKLTYNLCRPYMHGKKA